MSDVSTDRRLKLVQKIRQEQNQNRQAIKTRERILYGEPTKQPWGEPEPESFENFGKEGTDGEGMQASSFGLRMLVALFLFGGYFFLARSQSSIAGLDADKIFTEINRYSGVEINLFDFIDNITYTLNIDALNKQ